MKKKIDIKGLLTVRLPMTPNFISYETDHSITRTVHIREVPEDTLKIIGREWTKELIARAKRARRLKDTTANVKEK